MSGRLAVAAGAAPRASRRRSRPRRRPASARSLGGACTPRVASSSVIESRNTTGSPSVHEVGGARLALVGAEHEALDDVVDVRRRRSGGGRRRSTRTCPPRPSPTIVGRTVGRPVPRRSAAGRRRSRSRRRLASRTSRSARALVARVERLRVGPQRGSTRRRGRAGRPRAGRPRCRRGRSARRPPRSSPAARWRCPSTLTLLEVSRVAPVARAPPRRGRRTCSPRRRRAWRPRRRGRP